MYKPIASFVTVILIFTHCRLSGQPRWQYSPVKDDEAKLIWLQREIKKQYEKDSLTIDGENKKYRLEIYRERFKTINELFTAKEVITVAEASNYINNITNEIIIKNPELKGLQPRVIFSRAWWPNAYSTGEGTIVFNIDLFIKLHNESQVAFVLCHELAHLYLEHSHKKINHYITTVYSDEFQKKLKQIKKQQYEKNAGLDKLEMGIAFTSLRHSREFETEADTIGFRFLQNTNYDCKEALICLAVLDKIDEETLDYTEQLPKIFSFAGYPFRESWIRKEAAFFGVTTGTRKTKPIDDSLKTHPDCKARIKILEPLVSPTTPEGRKVYIQEREQFVQLQQLFAFEEVNHCFHSGNIAKSLFHALKLVDKKIDDPFLATTIGRCFNELYEKQKNHRLSEIVELPSPFREKNYNTVLEFISNLSLRDIAGIGYHYMNQYNSLSSTNTAFAEAFELSRKNYTEINKK